MTNNLSILKNNSLDLWLKKTGLPLTNSGRGRWRLQMSHKYAKYCVEVVEQGEWVSFVAVLVGAASGSEAQKFYQFALELNMLINAAQIAFDEEKLILVGNTNSEDIREDQIYRDLTLFHKTHEYAYGELLSKAEQLSVKLKPL